MGFIKKKYRKKRKVYGFFIGRKQALFIVLIIGAMFLSLAFSQRLFKDGKHFDHIFSDAKSNNNRLFFKDALSGEPQAVMSYASAVF